MSTKPVNVAVIGYGWWGKIITATLEASPLLNVVLVVESDPKVNEIAQEDGKKKNFKVANDFSQATSSYEVEAIILCTPHQFHAQQIQLAAKAGKHVFCEKPLCLTFEDAKAAIDACNAAGVKLGIGHERRFEPAVIALREEIAKGTLGNVLQIEANFSQDKFFALPPDNWRLSNKFAPVGPLTATGIHLVDLAIAILGPAESVWARLSTRGSKFENGDGRFCVYGSQGWMEIRDNTHPENPTGWNVTTQLRGQEKKTHFMSPAPTVRSNLEAFAGGIREIAPYPVTQKEMLANVGALEAIMRSVVTQTIEPVQG